MLSWSPDGKSLAFFYSGPSKKEGVSQIDNATLKKRWWGSPSPDCVYSWAPAFSPDGASLAVACMMASDFNDLYVWPIAGGTARRVARVPGDFTGMTWTADGGSLIYAAGGDLWRVAAGVSGGQPEKLLADVAMPALSRDGRRLAFAKGGPDNVNLWEVGLTAPTRPSGPPKKLLSSSRMHGYPAFSPDGRRLAFGSDRSGAPEVWTSDADGSNAVALTAFGGAMRSGSPEWSPDGRLVAFDSWLEGRSGIYVVPSGGGPHRRVATGVVESSVPAWSIDGRWIYFAGRVERITEIFKVPVEGGSAIQLTTGGGWAPQPSADGTRIYYVKDDEIYSVSTAGRDERRVSGLPPLPPQFLDGWGLTPTGIYFVDPAPPRAGIDFFEFASSRIVRVVDLSGRPAPWGGPLAISRDGRRLLYPQLDGVSGDIMLVENFR
jgi:Tol biopolymer transport system component